eukprot:364116-Amphidinium_carterae.2
MAGVPSTAADNGDFTMVNGHIITLGTGVRRRHNDGTTTTAETSSYTMPMPVPMEADNTPPLPPQPPQSTQPDYIPQGSTKAKLNALTIIANSKPIQPDTFSPTMADQDNSTHLWWMWLSEPQCNQFSWDGTMVERDKG